VHKDDAERVRKERDDLLQAMARLHVERNSTRQECDNARGRVNDLLGEVEKERGLKLKAEGVSAGLVVEVGRGKAKINTMETEVSWQRGEVDKLRSDRLAEEA
jgi:hypothetical protein